LVSGPSKTDVKKYENLALEWGCLSPPVVSPKGEDFKIINGQAKYEGLRKAGVKEFPVIIVEPEDIIDEIKITLQLLLVKENQNILIESTLINELIDKGITRTQIGAILNKSKSWISKRELIIKQLASEVKELVVKKQIYPRVAEEIRKLPKNIQLLFSQNVINESLNKEDVRKLVYIYNNPNSSEGIKKQILEAPQTILKKDYNKIEKLKDNININSKISLLIKYTVEHIEEIIKLIQFKNESINSKDVNFESLKATINNIIINLEEETTKTEINIQKRQNIDLDLLKNAIIELYSILDNKNSSIENTNNEACCPGETGKEPDYDNR
jgi:ParB-like chromosome segregation protein Spo0J